MSLSSDTQSAVLTFAWRGVLGRRQEAKAAAGEGVEVRAHDRGAPPNGVPSSPASRDQLFSSCEVGETASERQKNGETAREAGCGGGGCGGGWTGRARDNCGCCSRLALPRPCSMLADQGWVISRSTYQFYSNLVSKGSTSLTAAECQHDDNHGCQQPAAANTTLWPIVLRGIGLLGLRAVSSINPSYLACSESSQASMPSFTRLDRLKLAARLKVHIHQLWCGKEKEPAPPSPPYAPPPHQVICFVMASEAAP